MGMEGVQVNSNHWPYNYVEFGTRPHQASVKVSIGRCIDNLSFGEQPEPERRPVELVLDRMTMRQVLDLARGLSTEQLRLAFLKAFEPELAVWIWGAAQAPKENFESLMRRIPL